MPTTKQRINITLNKDSNWMLKTLAKRDNVPVSAKAVKLLEDAMELEEDRVLTAIADARSKQKGKYFTHEQAWKSIK